MNPLKKLSTSICSINVSYMNFMGMHVGKRFCCATQKPVADCPLVEVQPPSIRIEVSRGPGDIHELKHVLKQTFFNDEPSIKLFGLTGEEYCGELLQVMLQGITYEESLLAKCNQTGQMVGFALNGEYDHDKFDTEIKRWSTQVKESRNKKLLALWNAMSREFNYKCIRPTARAMEIYYLGVVPKARRQGLAKKLVNESLVLAKMRGYGVVQVVCTSAKSAHICKSLGMKRGCVVEYDKLQMPSDGRPVATRPPPPPDDVVRIYYQLTC